MIFTIVFALAEKRSNPVTIRTTEPPEPGESPFMRASAPCDWGDRVRCRQSPAFAIVSGIWIAGALLACLAFYVKLRRAGLYLKERVYQDFRLQNVLLKIQVCAANSTTPPSVSF